ncbi:unnamed protein product [Notodromas monacha]|uniref:Uncharacterized protein n=1 Tax=Notodromas monacha TaxID=399045 RepID=A0A7R9BK79_9CRUS|nr:unnamed protein product [Notodromas monacha]CAG0915909.1 unnamed protein product [Notodromas monacha]
MSSDEDVRAISVGELSKIREELEASLVRGKVITVNLQVHRKLCLVHANSSEKSKKVRPPFGIALETLPKVRIELKNGAEAFVPRIINDLVEIIRTKSTDVPLVFRKAGSVSRVRYLEWCDWATQLGMPMQWPKSN